VSHIRTPLASLSESQIAALPSATRSRARRRGWVCPGYHRKLSQENTAAYLPLHPQIVRDASYMVGRMAALGYPFPSYMSWDDLAQECVFECWRVSGKAGFESRNWRLKVMELRLRKLSCQVRGDRDRLYHLPVSVKTIKTRRVRQELTSTAKESTTVLLPSEY